MIAVLKIVHLFLHIVELIIGLGEIGVVSLFFVLLNKILFVNVSLFEIVFHFLLVQ